MRKLSFVFVVFIAFISKSYAYLPNNPANSQGTLISNSEVLAKWEKQGDSLYYEITITTPTVFNDQTQPLIGGGYYNQSYIQFYGYEHDYNEKYPGSLSIIFDASSFPYGTRTYSGVMDITGWSDDWTTIQADYQFFDSSNNSHEASELFTPEGVWD